MCDKLDANNRHPSAKDQCQQKKGKSFKIEESKKQEECDERSDCRIEWISHSIIDTTKATTLR